MPRRKRLRWISAHPEITGLVPQGIRETGEVLLSVEEYEVLRLIDYQGLDQSEAAVKMNVSRQTVGRVLRQARFSLTQALVTGKRLRVEGGSYAMQGTDDPKPRDRGLENRNIEEVTIMPGQNTGTRTGQGRGQGQGRGCGQGTGRGRGQGTGRGRGQNCGQGRGQGGGDGSCVRKPTGETVKKEE